MYFDPSDRVSIQGGTSGAELRGRAIGSGDPITLVRATPSGYDGLRVYDYLGANPEIVWNNGNMPFAQGTFTPTLLGGGSNPTVAYSAQIGRWQRIGRLVFFSLVVTTTARSGGTGSLIIGGLPFTSATTGAHAMASIRISNVTWPGGNAIRAPWAQVVPSNTIIEVWAHVTAAGNAQMQIGDWAANGSIRASGFYEIP